MKRPIGKIRRFSRLANINSLSADDAQSAAEGILYQPLSHRRAGGAHQILHGLHRVLPDGGLAGEHQAGCAVQYGVVDVAHLGAGGYSPGVHAVQHLGHHHKGYPGCPAGSRKLFLAAGQLPQGHGVAKVAPGNDHLVHQRQKLWQRLYARKVFNFGKNFQLRCTGLCQRLPQAADIRSLRQALAEASAPQLKILAKIENLAGVQALPEFLPLVDEVVIARGDLGNAMPLWELPRCQKQLSAACRAAGVPFMVVTQMLDSMHTRAVPTRAEVSDIYNAVLDGASSLMLTGETAVGQYPVQAMEYLVRTARTAM